MKLILPTAEWAEDIWAYRQEFQDAGDSMDGTGGLRKMNDAMAWIEASERGRYPETTPPGLVPATQFLYVREEDHRIVGMLQARHYLSDYLLKFGGHIGYSVRPSERRKGYASEMLRDALPFYWDVLKTDRVLITCLEDNEGSRRTIMKNGGAYENTNYEPDDREYIQRYWIARPKKLLVTGFEPFGGKDINPSWEAVSKLPDQIGGWRLSKLLLPVVFGLAARKAIDNAEEQKADAVLCVGLAGKRSAVTPEMVAVNLRYSAIPDNAGNRPQDEPVIPGGPAAYFATLPVRAMAKAICDTGLPGEVSYSAGIYVCNDLMYSVLHHFSETDVKAGFIHVPNLPSQGEPSLPLDDTVRALAAAIQAL